MPDWQPGPRLAVPPIPDGEIAVDAPTDVARVIPGGPIMRLLPVLMIVATAGMIALFVVSGTARNPASLLFPAMMMVSAIGMIANGGRGATRTAEVDEGRKDYLRYLARLRGAVVENACRQRESLVWQHPDPTALWTLAGTRRMWERGRTDSDFCHVRVGLGSQRSAVKLNPPDLGPVNQLEPVGAMALRDFVRTHSTVDELPIALALPRFDVIVIDGEKARARDVVRAMVCQLAVLHGPELLAVDAVVDDAATPEWDWLKWLPHRRRPDREIPEHTVVIVDGGEAPDGDFATYGGVTVVELGRSLRTRESRNKLELSVSDDQLAAMGDVREVFARPDAMTALQAELCARRLAPYRPVQERATALGGDWAPMLGIGDPTTIRPETVWRPRRPRDRLRVAIGVAADGSVVELDLKEAADNGVRPHGLCVGATGSGKSEFLRTLALGLITTHSPESLNLVLVDFKGGATFLGLDRARHVAAVITNLSDEAPLVERMKDALAGEMNRRQEALRSAGQVASIADYGRARAAGAPLAPLPTLLVIVDEFSELLTQHPDFAELFVAIGRLGRSLGIHLLLATQRLDEGRLRGLESHLSYRVCLKTFSASESRAVIGIPDAFHLPGTPGAAFLRTGAAEPVAFHTAYVSGPCHPRPTPPARTAPAVRIFTASSPVSTGIDLTAHARQEASAATGRTVLDTVLDRLAGHGIPAHQVWLPPLTESPTVDALLSRDHARGPLTVPIGVVDRPFEQRRDPLLVELAGSAGNVAVVGATQSGKSTALRTLVIALSATHPPDLVQIYCLDFGGGALTALSALPHVGAVAGRADPDLVRRTVAELTAVLHTREEAFRRLGVDSMADYRSRRSAGDPAVSGDSFGDVFLIVDGWASLREEFDALELAINALATRGLSYGIHVVVTAPRWAEIRPPMKDQIGSRIELRLGDAGDSELNRKAAQHVPHGQPGRGITRDGMHMLVALPRLDGKQESAGVSAAIADAVAKMGARFGGARAPRVRLLPACVDHTELVKAGAEPSQLILGVDEDELGLVTMDFREHQNVLVLGDSECGKTAALRLICTELVRTYSPEQAQLMIIDYRRTLLGVVESDHLAGYAVSGAVVSAILPALMDRLRARIPGPDADQRQLRTRSWWSGPELYLIVDDYDLVCAGRENPLAPMIELLAHGKDLGLHLVVARRSGGAGRGLYEPLLVQLRELRCTGLLMSASPEEGVLIGSSRPIPLPPGRGRLITRNGERVIQLGWVAPCQ